MAVQDFTPEELEREEWRPFPDWEGIYEISDLGRCRRIADGQDGRKITTVIKKPAKSGWKYKYLAYKLCYGERSGQVYAHRAVLGAFVGQPPTIKHQANHKDGKKKNNRLTNLEWVTPTENQQHRYNRLGQSQNGVHNPSNKYTREKIERVLALHKSGQYTQRKIAKMVGIDYRYVNAIVLRKAWRHLDQP